MSGIEVRRAREGDVEAVVRLERKTASAPHWAEAEYREMVEARTESEGMRRAMFVAMRAGQVAGFAVGRAVGERPDVEAEIESIAVSEAERRQGVGSRLLEAAMEWCRKQGAEAIELEVRAGGIAAQRLYAAFGFAEVGRRKGYYHGPAEDAVEMRWEARAGVSCNV